MLDDKKRKEPTSLEINEGNDFKEVDEINKNPANQDVFEENLESDYEHKTSEKDDILNEVITEDVQEAKAEIDKVKEKQESKFKYLIYLSIILIITAVVLWFNLTETTTGPDGEQCQVYETIPDVLGHINLGFFFLLIGSIVFGFLISAIILWVFSKLYTKHYKLHQALANSLIGSFYSAITPGSSGGQFAQVYIFKKQGMAISSSASILVMSFIVYQICLILFGAISLITSMHAILNINVVPISIGDLHFDLPIWIFIALGFFLNLIVIFALVFMSLSRRFQNFVCNGVIGLLAKIRLIKDPEEKRKSIRLQVENYRIEFRRLQSNLAFTGLIFLIYCISIINTNIQPFLCGLALNAFDPSSIDTFGEVMAKIYDSIVYSNFHQMATGLLPLPGSAGVSEIVFGALFGPTGHYFSESFYLEGGGINILLLLWRFMTFYIPFIINGIVAATYKSRGMPIAERIVPVGDKKTMLTISLETYQERKFTSDIAYETRVMERKELLERIKNTTKKNTSKKKRSKNDDSEEIKEE